MTTDVSRLRNTTGAPIVIAATIDERNDGMAKTRLRFTAELPTEAAFRRYPNWMLALDEECEAGQDESTLRPHDRQDVIAKPTEHTAVTVTRADGSTRAGVLSDAYGGDNLWKTPEEAERLHVFDRGLRMVDLFAKHWVPVTGEPTYRYNDFRNFPLQVITRLPSAKTKKPHRLTLMPGGQVLYGELTVNAVKSRAPRRIRVGDVVAAPREILRGRSTGVLYHVRNGRRRQVGSFSRVIVAEPKSDVIHVKTRYARNATRTEDRALEHGVFTFDARTLESVAETITVNRQTWRYVRGGLHGTDLPRGLFGDLYSLVRSLDLTIGLRFSARVFSISEAAATTNLLEVEGREAAPGHARSGAWRIRIDAGGHTTHWLWLDAERRTLLAERMITPALDRETLIIYKR
jgi:hypothetical protein